MLVLDTNVLIDLEARRPEVLKVLTDLQKKNVLPPAVTFANYSEFYYGCLAKTKKSTQLILEELDKFDVLNTTKNSAKLFAEIKKDLEKKGQMVELFDVLVAAIVIDHKATLVTYDEGFNKIPGLSVIILRKV